MIFKVNAHFTSLKVEQGLTLFDMVVIITVVGLLLAPAVAQYNLWKIQKARGDTDNNLATVQRAIENYFYVNNRYPCPSIITDAPGSPSYGKESRVGLPISDCLPTGGLAATGGVPFEDLQLPEQASLDGWGNRISYTVTRQQTMPPGPQTKVGKITVQGRDCATGNLVMINDPAAAPPNGAHYILVSHGPNGNGATLADGAPGPQACGVSTESENCDNDATFIDAPPLADFTLGGPGCARSDDPTAGPGGNFFDDYLAVVSETPFKMWVSEQGAQPQNVLTTYPLVGIAPISSASFTPNYNLDVMGNIKLEPGVTGAGRAASSGYCDDPPAIGAATCFNVGQLTSDDPTAASSGMYSASGIRGIGKKTGAPPYPAVAPLEARSTAASVAAPNWSCPLPHQYVAGFKADGTPCCRGSGGVGGDCP